ncbi:ornithine cyclodeaminase family protein [Nocardioides cavernaquae]|uniref:Ornithine cyclodeaminase family protein n=1 Tax=Nocardioides cavernaquae TaxID=2321396 RepID=A0A3A5H3P1_9ACTN|nr:ornithine cyclodeaminase family protein [Nocardioides cavernaquae]RJS45252.1 ornithine cyclodeaminase family protein [Nocardioides cavernaquae]
MKTVNLTAEEVRAGVTMAEAIGAVREAFLGLEDGQFEQPVRTALRDGQFLVMTAHHRESATAIVKTLSLNPDRVPAIAGTATWAGLGDPASLVADAAAVTALRTGAVSGVATDLLAHPAADSMAIIGAGGQAADQVRAVNVVRPLRRLWISNRDQARAEALADTLQGEMAEVDICIAPSVGEAVRDAEIVSCSTSATAPILDASMLKPRVHVNAIGAFRPTMRELPDDLLGHSTVVVDDIEAILEESGEIIHALASGALELGDLTTLGRALNEALELRDRTVFKSVGVAAQDWAIVRLLATKYL